MRDKIKRKAYLKKYRREHREERNEKKRYKYATDVEYRERLKAKARVRVLKLWRKRRKKLVELLGNKCVICGKTSKKIHYHEIHGKEHLYGYSSIKYILEHIEDFVALCITCHSHVHFCMKHLGLTWKQIKDLVK